MITLDCVKDIKGRVNDVHIVYKSMVKLAGGKKNPLQGRVSKVVDCKGAILNGEYKKLVNEELASEGNDATFAPKPRTWGTWHINGLVLEHKGEYYLVLHTIEGEVQMETTYFVDDEKATAEQLADIKATLPKYDVGTQKDVGIQKQVREMDIKFGNILKLEF